MNQKELDKMFDKAQQKRMGAWFKSSYANQLAARQNIMDCKPLAAIACINFAVLDLKKVKLALLRKTGINRKANKK